MGTILSGILRIIHPEQYRAGMDVIRYIQQTTDAGHKIGHWTSVFNAVTLISDRHCPMHRDTGGDFRLYDIVTSVGDYTSAPMCLMPCGIQIRNSPGTLVAFSGAAIRHGVAPADGHRLCHAFYMRKSLQDHSAVRSCGWMTQSWYMGWLGRRI